MKRRVKILLIAIGVIIGLILIDSISAKVFDNTPILRLKENVNEESVYQKNKGILVDNYICTNGTEKSIFKWEKYTCPINKEIDKEEVKGNVFIESFHLDRDNKMITLNKKESDKVIAILDKLEYRKETCDGKPTYYITYNDVIYGLEIFSDYHITQTKKGESILSNEDREYFEKLIKKYFN